MVIDVPMQQGTHTSSLLIWLYGAPILVLHIDDVRGAMEGRKMAHFLKHAEIERFNFRTRE